MEEFFSQDYFEARQRFLEAVKKQDFEIESHLVENVKGPEGKDIFMDCAFKAGANPENLVVFVSGTHGPEGYCGSAVQTYFLENDILNKALEKASIGLIHAHNPFGFAWDSRFNEDNIDLNRNYLEDFSNPPQNPDYDLLAQWALPQSFDEKSINDATVNLMAFAQEKGFATLQNALTAGQYKHQKGVYFGGFGPSWSQRTLISTMDKWVKDANRLFLIDFHTGLGPFGHGEILSDFAPNSPQFQRIIEVFGDEASSTKSGASISAAVKGSLDGGICERYSKLTPVSIALEFGTLDPLSVFKATQATSWAQSYDSLSSEKGRAMRALSRDAFYPQAPEWKTKVINRSTDVIQRLIEKI